MKNPITAVLPCLHEENNLILKETMTVSQYITVGYKCDICKEETSIDSLEAQEFFHLSHTFGYMSIFEDGKHIEVDICQKCFKKILVDNKLI